MCIHTYIWELVFSVVAVLPPAKTFTVYYWTVLFYGFGLFQDRCKMICHDGKKKKKNNQKPNNPNHKIPF